MTKLSRREFLTLSAAAGVGLWISSRWPQKLLAETTELLDPVTQPKFAYPVPRALDPSFTYTGDGSGNYQVGTFPIQQDLGLRNPADNAVLLTSLWGYGESAALATFPGKTFVAQKDQPIDVQWTNNLVDGNGDPVPHLLPVDTSLHWAYTLHGYEDYTIADNGVPAVPHLHGGHTESDSDGNPEYFWSPTVNGQTVYGPRFVKSLYHYDNDQEAGTLWYHDHALGITRLNVYAGLAGFYILRDSQDTGELDNPLGLPAYPYEEALVIQDRMFDDSGALFYPAFPGDPFYDDFITDEGAILPPDLFPGGGPTALAEFFGDHIVVNGKIWPKMDVEPRHYRFRLLNGSDSRFYVLKLTLEGSSDLIPFYQIGTDDGFLHQPTEITQLVLGPGERADIVVDFSASALSGQRITMINTGPDEPFRGLNEDGSNNDGEGGVLLPADSDTTGLIMAFDVNQPLNESVDDNFDPNVTLRSEGYAVSGSVARTRKLALFEGEDEFGRLQPLLGTAEPIVNLAGETVNRSLGWFEPITENPSLGDVEIWEIYNATEDAHPIHIHLVSFEVLNRESFTGDVEEIPQPQHNGTTGIGGRLTNVDLEGDVRPPEANERGPKDTVQVYPGEVARVKAHFDRPGRYVWHCHILSHEDHEMMRPFHVMRETYMPLISKS